MAAPPAAPPGFLWYKPLAPLPLQAWRLPRSTSQPTRSTPRCSTPPSPRASSERLPTRGPARPSAGARGAGGRPLSVRPDVTAPPGVAAARSLAGRPACVTPAALGAGARRRSATPLPPKGQAFYPLVYIYRSIDARLALSRAAQPCNLPVAQRGLYAWRQQVTHSPKSQQHWVVGPNEDLGSTSKADSARAGCQRALRAFWQRRVGRGRAAAPWVRLTGGGGTGPPGSSTRPARRQAANHAQHRATASRVWAPLQAASPFLIIYHDTASISRNSAGWASGAACAQQCHRSPDYLIDAPRARHIHSPTFDAYPEPQPAPGGRANSRARWPQNTRPSSGSRRRCWEAGRPKTRGPTTSPTACWPACTVRQAAAACRRAAQAAGAAPGRWASPHCPAACLNTHPTKPPPPF